MHLPDREKDRADVEEVVDVDDIGEFDDMEEMIQFIKTGKGYEYENVGSF